MSSLKASSSQEGQRDLMEKMIFELNPKERERLSHLKSRRTLGRRDCANKDVEECKRCLEVDLAVIWAYEWINKNQVGEVVRNRSLESVKCQLTKLEFYGREGCTLEPLLCLNSALTNHPR